MRLTFGIVTVKGRSMEPTLREDDRLLVHWSRQRARPGRVVVVQLPDRRPLSVKRLAFREADGWWVERDSRTEGVDSWLVGAIPEGDVRGVVVCRIAPRPGLIAKAPQ